MGAAVSFVSRKQLAQESIEEYSKVLNQLASLCDFKDCCLDRLLRTIFIAGLRSNKIMAAIITDCEDKKFEEVVERAKTIEQLNIDIEEINPACRAAEMNAVRTNKNRFGQEVRGGSNTDKKRGSINASYLCGRCLTKGRHYASNCFAKDLKCNSCSMKGHIAKACRNKKSSHKSNHINNAKVEPGNNHKNDSDSDEFDQSKYFVIKHVRKGRKSSKSSSSSVTSSSSSIADLDEFPEMTSAHTPPSPASPRNVSPHSNRFSALLQHADTMQDDDTADGDKGETTASYAEAACRPHMGSKQNMSKQNGSPFLE